MVFCLFVFILDQSRSCNHCNRVFPFQVEMCLEGEKTSFQKKTTQTSFPLMLQWIFFLLPIFFFHLENNISVPSTSYCWSLPVDQQNKILFPQEIRCWPISKKKKACNKKLFLLIWCLVLFQFSKPISFFISLTKVEFLRLLLFSSPPTTPLSYGFTLVCLLQWS